MIPKIPTPISHAHVDPASVTDPHGNAIPHPLHGMFKAILPEITAAVTDESDKGTPPADINKKVVARLHAAHPGAIGSAFIEILLQFLPSIIQAILALVHKPPAPPAPVAPAHNP